MKKNKNLIVRILLFALNTFSWIIGFALLLTITSLLINDNEFIFHIKSKHHFTYLFIKNILNILGPSWADLMLNGGAVLLFIKIFKNFIEIFIFEKKG